MPKKTKIDPYRLARKISRLTKAQKAIIGALGIDERATVDILKNSLDREKLNEMVIRYEANRKNPEIAEMILKAYGILKNQQNRKRGGLSAPTIQIF